MTTAVNQSQHILKNYVTELLVREDNSTESRPKLLFKAVCFWRNLASQNLLRIKLV